MMRVRTGGVELDVTDEVQLASMRENGLLGPDAEVQTADGWMPLTPPAPRKRARTDDPWEAWKEVDEQDADQIYRQYVQREPDVEALPSSAVTQMARPIIAGPPTALPVEALEPIPAGASVPLPPVRQNVPPATGAAQVTARDEGRGAAQRSPVKTVEAGAPSPPPLVLPAGGSTGGGRAGAPPGPALPGTTAPHDGGEVIRLPPRKRPFQPAPAPPAATVPLVRPWRLLGMIAAGLAVLGGMWAAVELASPDQTEVMSVSSERPPTAVDLDPLADVERELRAASLGDLHEVSRPGDLGDGILVDLQKLRIDVQRVDAPVTRWVGRKNDHPAEAEVHITFTTSGELDRELGAIALVVGRYKKRYTIDMPVIEGIWERDGEHKSRAIDAKLAEQFAQDRITLSTLLGVQ